MMSQKSPSLEGLDAWSNDPQIYSENRKMSTFSDSNQQSKGSDLSIQMTRSPAAEKQNVRWQLPKMVTETQVSQRVRK